MLKTTGLVNLCGIVGLIYNERNGIDIFSKLQSNVNFNTQKLHIIHFLNPICNMVHNYFDQKNNESIAISQKPQNPTLLGK